MGEETGDVGHGYPGMPWTMGACQVTARNAASQGQLAREWNRPAKDTGFQDAGETRSSYESRGSRMKAPVQQPSLGLKVRGMRWRTLRDPISHGGKSTVGEGAAGRHTGAAGGGGMRRAYSDAHGAKVRVKANLKDQDAVCPNRPPHLIH